MAKQYQESGLLCLSDTHFGKETKSFDPDVARKRLNALGKKVIHLRALQSDLELTELVVCCLGDMVDGAEIYPSQAHHQAITDPRQQADEFSAYFADWLKDQAKVWPTVRVEAVLGNHGRVSKRHAEATNFDGIFYDYLRLRLPAEISLGRNERDDEFLRRIVVRKHAYLLAHGAGVKMYQRTPWYGLENRAKDYMTGPLGPFSAFVVGHFHTCGSAPANNVEIVCNGTLVTDDEWSRQMLGREPDSRCWFWGIDDKRPITWSYKLDLAPP